MRGGAQEYLNKIQQRLDHIAQRSNNNSRQPTAPKPCQSIPVQGVGTANSVGGAMGGDGGKRRGQQTLTKLPGGIAPIGRETLAEKEKRWREREREDLEFLTREREREREREQSQAPPKRQRRPESQEMWRRNLSGYHHVPPYWLQSTHTTIPTYCTHFASTHSLINPHYTSHVLLLLATFRPQPAPCTTPPT